MSAAPSVEQVKLNENVSQSVSVSASSIIPPWVHVFVKSTKSTSLRTQGTCYGRCTCK